MKSDGCKKSQFIAKGLTQISRIDYENTFLPVMIGIFQSMDLASFYFF